MGRLNIRCRHLLLPFTALANEATNILPKTRPVRLSLFRCVNLLLSNVTCLDLAAQFLGAKNAAAVIGRVICFVVSV